MKVHPAMLMKTKERGKIRVPNVRKDAWTSSPKPVVRRWGHDSNFWLLTPSFCFKMKVYPAMFMKTKERGKARAPNVRNGAWAPKSEACGVQGGSQF